MDLHVPTVTLGPVAIDSWTLFGRLPVAIALAALALSVAPRAGWRRASLLLSGVAAGAAVGVAVLPSVLGAVAGGFAAAALTLRLLGAPAPGALPVAAWLLALVGVGRIGCLLAGCCFGVVTHAPWGVTYPAGSMAAVLHAHVGLVAEGARSAPVHPLPIYESLGTAVLLAALPLLRRRLRHGGAAALASAGGYLVLRAVLDAWRAMVNTRWSVVQVGPLSAFQWAALAAAAACLAGAAALSRRPRRTPAAPAPAAPAPAAPAPDLATLAIAWAVQAALVDLSLSRLTPFLAAVAALTLAFSAALIVPALLAAAGPAWHRVPAALLPLLLLPTGLRAAEGREAIGRHWIYATALPEGPEPVDQAAGTGPGERVPPSGPGEEPPRPAEPAPPTQRSPDPDAARIVRIGDQGTPESQLAARAEALRPHHRSTVSVFGGGGSTSYKVTDTSSCGGPTTYRYYDRSDVRAGVSFERVSGRGGVEGQEEESDTWQVRGSARRTVSKDRFGSNGQVTTLVPGHVGVRWTVGGMYQWDRPRAGLGLGALVGSDTSHDSLHPWFTSDELVLYPAIYVRFGRGTFGFEAATLALHDPSDQPYAGIYIGAPDLRLRLGATSQFSRELATTTAVSVDFSFRAAPTRWQLHLNAREGVEATLRFGFDLP